MALKRVAAPGLTCPCFQHLPQVSLTSSTLDGVSGFRFVDEALSISLEGFTGTITLNKVLAPSSPKTTKKRKLNEDVLSRTAALRNDDKIPIYSQASMAMDADDDDNDAEAVDCTPFPQNPPVEPEMPSSPSSSSSQVSVVCGGESLGLIDETPSASPPPKTQVVPADPTARPHSVRRSRQVPPRNNLPISHPSPLLSPPLPSFPLSSPILPSPILHPIIITITTITIIIIIIIIIILNPQPSTLNPQPSTLNPQPSTPYQR
jgi:hypothetical protein